ncbi:hypothetical protein NXS19_001343 [Fusarium pseudograminearum]|nr:hypothetical protein NXS19_001343 [Fusarium pseudograminearum]
MDEDNTMEGNPNHCADEDNMMEDLKAELAEVKKQLAAREEQFIELSQRTAAMQTEFSNIVATLNQKNTDFNKRFSKTKADAAQRAETIDEKLEILDERYTRAYEAQTEQAEYLWSCYARTRDDEIEALTGRLDAVENEVKIMEIGSMRIKRDAIQKDHLSSKLWMALTGDRPSPTPDRKRQAREARLPLPERLMSDESESEG